MRHINDYHPFQYYQLNVSGASEKLHAHIFPYFEINKYEREPNTGRGVLYYQTSSERSYHQDVLVMVPFFPSGRMLQ
jgi:hypothetical protein